MAKAKTRIYVVNGPNKQQLVRAYSSTQARSYVAEQAYSVEVASQDTLVDLLDAGCKIEDAAKPETADAFVEPQGIQGSGVAEERSPHITEVA